jgi:nucleoside-diphosphate-sugar epimerase
MTLETGLGPVVLDDLDAIAACDLPWEGLAGSRVLVTGAAGLLPRYMLLTLARLNETRRLGIRLWGLVRDRQRAIGRLAPLVESGTLELVVQDVAEPLTVAEPFDYIVHAASQASPKYYGRDPVGTLAANTLGTHHLLRHAAQQGCRGFLFFSSGEVYGDLGRSGRLENPSGIAETDYGYLDPTQVRSCYAESKRLGETLCAAFAHQYGLAATIVRPFHTYGPGIDLADGRVFSDFVADILAGRDITLTSAGDARRSLCYLADATAGFFTVLLRGQPGQAYNVGNPACEISIRDLAQLLVGLFPEKGLGVRLSQPQRHAGYLPSPLARTQPDIGRILALGWTPKVGLAEGFMRTIRSFA